ncbi:MAG: hypothetical protein MI799_13525 [Desulfobacterales bacterium]|nr:hypothetical protein [Desulfobacterales bacterium]
MNKSTSKMLYQIRATAMITIAAFFGKILGDSVKAKELVCQFAAFDYVGIALVACIGFLVSSFLYKKDAKK